ncbi:hypothetical protein Tco_1253388 [Tanacetum coccineum]
MGESILSREQNSSISVMEKRPICSYRTANKITSLNEWSHGSNYYEFIETPQQVELFGQNASVNVLKISESQVQVPSKRARQCCQGGKYKSSTQAVHLMLRIKDIRRALLLRHSKEPSFLLQPPAPATCQRVSSCVISVVPHSLQNVSPLNGNVFGDTFLICNCQLPLCFRVGTLHDKHSYLNPREDLKGYHYTEAVVAYPRTSIPTSLASEAQYRGLFQEVLGFTDITLRMDSSNSYYDPICCYFFFLNCLHFGDSDFLLPRRSDFSLASRASGLLKTQGTASHNLDVCIFGGRQQVAVIIAKGLSTGILYHKLLMEADYAQWSNIKEE